MIGSRRRSRSTTNVWPGYVDALSALLMLVIFMLLVYVVSQLYLSQTLSDRDNQLARLSAQLNELSELLGLEQSKTEALENQIVRLQDDYSTSLKRNDQLIEQLESNREQLMRQTASVEAQAEQLARMEEAVGEKDQISASQQAMILQLSNQIVSLREQLRQIASALELQQQMIPGSKAVNSRNEYVEPLPKVVQVDETA